MPNPGKSLEQLAKTGTLKKHPGRYRTRVKAAEDFKPLGAPPKHLDPREAAAWNEIRRKAPPGTLAVSDFMLVELAARLLVKSRDDWANFTATNSRVLQSIANDLGMSPIKRGRVSVAKKDKEKSSLCDLYEIMNAPTWPPN